MNDPVVLTIIAKTLLCVILAVGAVLCVVYGYRMFNHHANPQGSRMILSALGLKVTAQGAGAVLAAQSIAWAWLSVHVSPNYLASNSVTRVYSFVTPQGDVQAPTVMASVKGFDGTLPEYERAFSDALRSSAKQGHYKIAGMPALVDYGSVVPVTDRNGTVFYSTTLKSADATAEVQFTPIKRIDYAGKATIVFEPSSATVKESKKP